MAAVFQLTDTNPHTVKARRFYGALNLDKNAQTCHVQFYASPMTSGQVIAAANALAASGAAQALCLPPNGIELAEGALSFQSDTQPSGAGIAIYYEPLNGAAE